MTDWKTVDPERGVGRCWAWEPEFNGDCIAPLDERGHCAWCLKRLADMNRRPGEGRVGVDTLAELRAIRGLLERLVPSVEAMAGRYGLCFRCGREGEPAAWVWVGGGSVAWWYPSRAIGLERHRQFFTEAGKPDVEIPAVLHPACADCTRRAVLRKTIDREDPREEVAPELLRRFAPELTP